MLRCQLENARRKLDKACALAADMHQTFRHLENIWNLMAEAEMLLRGADDSAWRLSQELERMRAGQSN